MKLKLQSPIEHGNFRAGNQAQNNTDSRHKTIFEFIHSGVFAYLTFNRRFTTETISLKTLKQRSDTLQ